MEKIIEFSTIQNRKGYGGVFPFPENEKSVNCQNINWQAIFF